MVILKIILVVAALARCDRHGSILRVLLAIALEPLGDVGAANGAALISIGDSLPAVAAAVVVAARRHVAVLRIVPEVTFAIRPLEANRTLLWVRGWEFADSDWARVAAGRKRCRRSRWFEGVRPRVHVIQRVDVRRHRIGWEQPSRHGKPAIGRRRWLCEHGGHATYHYCRIVGRSTALGIEAEPEKVDVDVCPLESPRVA